MLRRVILVSFAVRIASIKFQICFQLGQFESKFRWFFVRYVSQLRCFGFRFVLNVGKIKRTDFENIYIFQYFTSQ